MLFEHLVRRIVAGDATGLLAALEKEVVATDVDSSSPTPSALGGFAPLLHIAVVCAQPACATILVSAGASIHDVDAFGWSAVDLAWLRCGAAMVSSLKAASVAEQRLPPRVSSSTAAAFLRSLPPPGWADGAINVQ